MLLKQINLFLFLCTIIFYLMIPLYSFSGGDGSSLNPYMISNCTHLQNISNDLNGNYQLNNSIDCNIPPFNLGTGFDSIGNISARFNGTFDGDSFTIDGLFIDKPTINYIGLFGYTDSQSEIKNIGIINSIIEGRQSVGSFVGRNEGTMLNIFAINLSITGDVGTVGGLIGNNFGNISNCFVENLTADTNNNGNGGGIAATNGFSGSINSCYVISSNISAGSGNTIGGLTGQNSGLINITYVKHSYVDGDTRIGGLVGWNYYAQIFNSYSSNTTVIGITNVGGLVGLSYTASWTGDNSYIINSYSSNSVSGTTNVGGLVGMSESDNTYYSYINNSFSLSNVSGTTNVGGFLGNNNGNAALINNSFWFNTSGNPSLGIATDSNVVSQNVTPSTNLSYFFIQTNYPINIWDLSIWNFNDNFQPTLDIENLNFGSSSSSISSLFPLQSIFSLIVILIILGFFFK